LIPKEEGVETESLPTILAAFSLLNFLGFEFSKTDLPDSSG
jgi:hypothetical protein